MLRAGFYALVLFGAVPFALSQALLLVPRAPLARPPAGWREVKVISQGLRLRGWLNPCAPTLRPAAVVVHGLGDSLESYLEVGSALRRRGHSVLLLDLRAHGASQGRYTTLGARVRAPLLAICDAADRRMPEPVVRRVYDAHPGPKRFWLCPGADHVGASLHPDYERQLVGFLEDAGA
jgi:pimeloyl-ACP methyl ester carboxylesterase